MPQQGTLGGLFEKSPPRPLKNFLYFGKNFKSKSF